MSAIFSSRQTPVATQVADLPLCLSQSSENVTALSAHVINPDGGAPVIEEVHTDHGDRYPAQGAASEKIRYLLARSAKMRVEQTEEERERPCPKCGAREEHQKEPRTLPDWLGLGETEFCDLCGADHEHRSPECKRPLEQYSLEILLHMALGVERAYTDIHRPMTEEQIVLNREYFKRIVEAVLSSNMYHIGDRIERCSAEQRWEELRDEAAELFRKVHGGGTARAFYKYCSHDYSESELIGTITSLRRDLEQVEPA
ncbi:hypothetical protein [Paraburkholderia sp. GAS348]|uniref:hypothetical protein n=1 Tax=Paraburkholderia sp. GAS348 TaxID=3035132 RepID=UPI003D25860E